MRWQHPERGLISPAQFVVFAEQTGLMELLTEAVLRIALPQCAAWRADGHDVVVAVNVSGRDLGDRSFPGACRRAARRGRPRARARSSSRSPRTRCSPIRCARSTVLENLREVGVRLAVDDFGAGRTSLHYLRKLRVDSLKIDRSFVLDLLERHRQPGDRALDRRARPSARPAGRRGGRRDRRHARPARRLRLRPRAGPPLQPSGAGRSARPRRALRSAAGCRHGATSRASSTGL